MIEDSDTFEEMTDKQHRELIEALTKRRSPHCLSWTEVGKKLFYVEPMRRPDVFGEHPDKEEKEQ